jgi:nickel-type superoxide dismutase maturation protease
VQSPLLRVAVAEHSMEPVLWPGDWLLVRRTRRIRPGQIVLARHPGRPGMLIVKRAARREADGWWLESANPAAGAVDSARFGAVPDALIEGRVLLRYWPLRRRPRRSPGDLLCRNGPGYPSGAGAGGSRREKRGGPADQGGASGTQRCRRVSGPSGPARRPLRPAC